MQNKNIVNTCLIINLGIPNLMVVTREEPPYVMIRYIAAEIINPYPNIHQQLLQPHGQHHHHHHNHGKSKRKSESNKLASSKMRKL